MRNRQFRSEENRSQGNSFALRILQYTDCPHRGGALAGTHHVLLERRRTRTRQVSRRTFMARVQKKTECVCTYLKKVVVESQQSLPSSAVRCQGLSRKGINRPLIGLLAACQQATRTLSSGSM